MLLTVLLLQLQTTVSDQEFQIKELQEQLTARDEQVKATALYLTPTGCYESRWEAEVRTSWTCFGKTG